MITSTWRINHSKEELQAIFEAQGITVDIYDYTKVLGNRGEEIQDYLNNNVYDKFIVIDDQTYDIVNVIGDTNVFKIMSHKGLTELDYKEICYDFIYKL